jgi:hypothetical protein
LPNRPLPFWEWALIPAPPHQRWPWANAPVNAPEPAIATWHCAGQNTRTVDLAARTPDGDPDDDLHDDLDDDLDDDRI